MKRIQTFLFFLFVFFLATGTGRDQKDRISASMQCIPSPARDLLEYVKIQCDDKYQGRLTGTPEYQACAEWLAGEFSKWGISPAGDNGTWFQWFEVPYTLVFPDCGVTLHIPLANKGEILKPYKYVSEFMPGSTSGNGEVTAGVVYAGYGITAPELGYDDYAGHRC